jgi:hypothetical protein
MGTSGNAPTVGIDADWLAGFDVFDHRDEGIVLTHDACGWWQWYGGYHPAPGLEDSRLLDLLRDAAGHVCPR